MLKPTPTCFQVKSVGHQIVNVNYVVSGLNEEKSEMSIINDDGETIVEVKQKKEAQIKEILQVKGTYNVCFKSTDDSFKMMSFDIDLEGLEKNYAQADQMDELTRILQRTQKNFQSIYRNQHWQSDRENVHAILLEQTDKSVKLCGMLKVVLLIGISGAQIYIVYAFFRDRTFGPSV